MYIYHKSNPFYSRRSNNSSRGRSRVLTSHCLVDDQHTVYLNKEPPTFILAVQLRISTHTTVLGKVVEGWNIPVAVCSSRSIFKVCCSTVCGLQFLYCCFFHWVKKFYSSSLFVVMVHSTIFFVSF